jgi:hypothetical protein
MYVQFSVYVQFMCKANFCFLGFEGYVKIPEGYVKIQSQKNRATVKI